MSRKRRKNRGRPKGRRKVPFPLRVYPEQRQTLKILSEIMEGTPPVNGLIQEAIEQFIDSKLSNPSLRARYDARITPRLRALA